MFQVTDYLHSVFAKRKSPNKLKVTMVIGAKPWLADTQHALYEAGKAAVRRGTAPAAIPNFFGINSADARHTWA